MASFFKEFKEFIDRGNVIDLAVAVIIGGAFGAIINSLINDIIMPLIGILLGGVDFSGLSITVGSAVVTYGNFIQAIVNFVVIALAIFLVVRAYNRLQVQKEAEAPAEPTTKECPYCYTEIPIQATRCPHCTSQLEAA
jgi:large conductance mechanosensitive channel